MLKYNHKEQMENQRRQYQDSTRIAGEEAVRSRPLVPDHSSKQRGRRFHWLTMIPSIRPMPASPALPRSDQSIHGTPLRNADEVLPIVFSTVIPVFSQFGPTYNAVHFFDNGVFSVIIYRGNAIYSKGLVC